MFVACAKVDASTYSRFPFRERLSVLKWSRENVYGGSERMKMFEGVLTRCLDATADENFIRRAIAEVWSGSFIPDV